MITPSLMELISFVVIKEKTQDVAAKILDLGVFHPVDIRHIEDALSSLTPTMIDKQYQELDLLYSKISEISRKINLELKKDYLDNLELLSFSQSEKFLNSIEQEITPVLLKKEEISQEINIDQSMLAHVKEYMPLPFKSSSGYSFLEISNGKIEDKNIIVLEKSLKDIPHVFYPFRQEGSVVSAMMIGLRRDRGYLNNVLRDVGWEEINIPDGQLLTFEAQEKITHKIQENKLKLEQLKKETLSFSEKYKAELNKINSQINFNKSLLEAKRYTCLTEKTVLFSGWVPLESKDRFIKEIKNITEVSYLESKTAESLPVNKDEIPVKYQHSKILKPFELLIDSYGIPRYGTIDPTIFVAISFLIMFGAMFGDVGHALVLIVISFILGWKIKSERIKQPKNLMFYCGVSSLVFGFLYGDFFGFEFKALWIRPIENISEFFKYSIFFGIGLISLGIIINVINALKDKDYSKAIFDKSGLIGGLIYWSAIGLIIKSFLSRETVPLYLSATVILGVVLIFLFPLVECIIKKKFSHFLETFMESIINLLEIFMGYLANTVSFIRVSAFALAHTGLFIAIFTLAKMVQGNADSAGLMSWVVIILGNILVIGLEGLVVSIQSVRLNYYEFFSKFFVSGKQLYKPLTQILS